MGSGTSRASNPQSVNGDGAVNEKVLQCRGWTVPRCVRRWTSSAAVDLEVAIPPPGKGQVRVKVYAASVNPVDVKRATFGSRGGSPLFSVPGSSYGSTVSSSFPDPVPSFPFPYVMGVEGAGLVESVGWDSSEQGEFDLRVGDRVAFLADVTQSFGGTFCQYAVVHADAVGRIPTSCDDNDYIDFVEAAAIPCAAGAAYVALFDRLRVESGRCIFISGASGGVGTVAVQLAKYVGLCVLASCSTVNVPYVQQLGADFVFDYTVTDVVRACREHTQGIGVDYVLELASEAFACEHAAALRFGGSLCVLPGAIAANAAYCNAFFRNQISVSYVCLAGLYGSDLTRKLLRFVVEESLRLYKNGAFRLYLETASIERVRDVMEVVAPGHVRGKIVLTDFHPGESPKIDQVVGSRRRKQARDVVSKVTPTQDDSAR